MNNKYYKSKHIIVVLGLILLSLVIFAINEWINASCDGSVVNIIYSILNNIASAILISGILGVIDAYFLKSSLIDLILEKVKVKEQINSTGLEEVLPGIRNIDYSSYIKKAKKNIDIVHIYGRTWTNNYGDEIKEKLLKSNCTIRIVLMNPESPFVPALEKHFDYKQDELVKYIKDVSKVWRDMNKKVSKGKKRKKQGTIELYYHSGQPTNAMYRIDNRIVVVQTKSTKEKTTRLPSMIFRNLYNGECLYKTYLNEINELVRESIKVELD